MRFDGWNVSYQGPAGGSGGRGSGGAPDRPAPAPVPAPQGADLYGWQICRARMDTDPPSLEDAANYPVFAANRERILQTLGLGLAGGKNMLDLEDIQFVVVIAQQVDGSIRPLGADHPLLGQMHLVISEKLLGGEDHGMIAVLPNGRMVPFVPAGGIQG